jgi:hypothetical protein
MFGAPLRRVKRQKPPVAVSFCLCFVAAEAVPMARSQGRSGAAMAAMAL